MANTDKELSTTGKIDMTPVRDYVDSKVSSAINSRMLVVSDKSELSSMTSIAAGTMALVNNSNPELYVYASYVENVKLIQLK